MQPSLASDVQRAAHFHPARPEATTQRRAPGAHTFAEVYCEKHQLVPEDFADVVLRRTMYPHAQILRGVIRWLKPDFFTSDRHFIAAVGRLTDLHDFERETDDFFHHPRNTGWLRRTLRIRISARRLRALMKTTLRTPPSATAAPEPDAPAQPA